MLLNLKYIEINFVESNLQFLKFIWPAKNIMFTIVLFFILFLSLSYLKDTTDFIHFLVRAKVREGTIFVSMDVTTMPQSEAIKLVCFSCEKFHNYDPAIPTQYLREIIRLILRGNSFQFGGKNYLQTHGAAMGT